jgi:transposase
MAKPLVPDDLWAAVAPLLPLERPQPQGGRPRLSDRAALTGIVFVLTTGTGWERLPVEMGCGSGMTCWRRLREFRTPIGIITGFAELLQEAAEQGQPVPMLEWTRDISAAAAHLLELLQDTTRYASVDWTSPGEVESAQVRS